jgi:hypothetical protein
MNHRSSFRVHVIWKDRNYPYELDWKEGFEKAGCTVTEVHSQADADAYVLLHGVTANDTCNLESLSWLAEKKGRKLAIVVNEHKFINPRKSFFDKCGITAGSQSDRQAIWKHAIWIPAALNPDAFREVVKRADRKIEMGFRGHRYNKQNVANNRNRIVEFFAKTHEEVKLGEPHFIQGRHGWSAFLNSIKAIPSCEAGHVGHEVIVSRHFDAIGTKTVQVMYPGRFGGIIDESNYIRLDLDHNNLQEVMDKLKDESFCEELASRTREKICDTHTVAHGVRKSLDWLNGPIA